MEKVSVKIDKDVYKHLQQLKLDNDKKSISDVIKQILKEQLCLDL